MTVVGKFYLDPGDRMAGRYVPPRVCVVLVGWGRGGGPRNVAVRYVDDGSVAVVPFSRRLRRVSSVQVMPDYGMSRIVEV